MQGVDFIYLKIDSQMRGNIAADLAGTLPSWPHGCVLAPALPEEGRLTIDGHQRWFNADVDIVQLLRDGGFKAMNGSPADVEPGLVVVCDATTTDQLQAIANHIVSANPRPLPAGTAGLASCLPRALAVPDRGTPGWPRCRRSLAIVGTPAAAIQARFAAENGKEVLVLGPNELPAQVDGYDALLLTGGATASRVLRWLGVNSIDLCGEAYPRVPVGLCRGGSHDGMPVALKSGAFGPPEVISLALDRLASGA